MNGICSGRTRVKICGFTRAEDLAAAVRLGVDAVGFVFYPPSPRALKPEQAFRLARELPPFVTRVCLFVDAEPGWIAEAAESVGAGLLQFHGHETPEQCVAAGKPWIKACRVGAPGQDSRLALTEWIAHYAGSSGILFDTYTPAYGGSGKVFDWSLIPTESAAPVVLSGGLHAGNLARALERVRPYAVDVSSGVESSPGIKCPDRMKSFMRVLRAHDAGW
jgi:phosphoribosylanthranilate isomerase